MRRLTREDGFAVPLALSVILIVAAFGGVAITLATHNIDRSSRDRASARALAAADAGIDTAAFRMAKLVLGSKINGLLDPGSQGALQAVTNQLECLSISVGSAVVVSSTGCPASAAERVDEEVNGDGVGDPAEFRYWVKLGGNVGTPQAPLLERKVVAVGDADGVVRRVMATYRVDLRAPVAALLTRTSWVECTAKVPAPGSDPAAGC